MSNNFQEQFPSLEGMQVMSGKNVRKFDAKPSINDALWDAIYCEDIQKHCLDKQKVKEAIEKCCTIDESGVDVIYPMGLMKELGL